MVILKQGEQRKRVAFERATSKVTKDFEKKAVALKLKFS